MGKMGLKFINRFKKGEKYDFLWKSEEEGGGGGGGGGGGDTGTLLY